MLVGMGIEEMLVVEIEWLLCLRDKFTRRVVFVRYLIKKIVFTYLCVKISRRC